jgi:hypothetical protein
MPPGSTPYLRDFVLPPPFSAIVAMLIVAGMARIGLWWLSRALEPRALEPRGFEPPSAIDVALGFVAVVSLVAAAAHAVAWINVAPLASLRAIGAGLALANAGWCNRRALSAVTSGARQLRAAVTRGSWLARWMVGAAALTLGALAIASLGPPTDPDTLAYHLAVPLDWLQHGARPTPDWLHARLAGLGETLNLLGLASGTDALGAVLQLAGVAVAAAALISVARADRDRLLALALVAGCPLLTSLVLTSKALLLPAAATTAVMACVIASREQARPLDSRRLWACWVALSFAAASKYSFLLSVGPAAIILLLHARQTGRVVRSVVAAIAAGVTIAAPVFLRTAAWYGDPASPLLEKFRQAPDLIVATFAAYLRNFEMDHSLGHLVRAPFLMTWTFDPGFFSGVLGLGALAGLLALACDRRDRDILVAALMTAAMALAGGQLQARFLLEPMWWSGALVVASRSNAGKTALSWLLGGQMVATTVAALAVGGLYAPAVVSAAAREAVLRQAASEYRLTAWLNTILPPAAVVANDQRPVLYFERPSTSGDLARMIDLAYLPRNEQRALLVAALERHHVNTLVVHEPVDVSPFHDLVKDLGRPIAVGEFEPGSRRFWRRDPPVRVYVYAFPP